MINMTEAQASRLPRARETPLAHVVPPSGGMTRIKTTFRLKPGLHAKTRSPRRRSRSSRSAFYNLTISDQI